MQKFDSVWNKNDLIKFLELKKGETINLHVFNEYRLPDEGFNMIEYISNNLDQLEGQIKEVVFYVPYEKLPKEIFQKIYDVAQKLADKDIASSICVNHTFQDDRFYQEKEIQWDIETIAQANFEIDNICKFIRNNNFSPLEALAYIHDYVSTLTNYRESQSNHAWYQKDQFFAGAFLAFPEFVCMGYSTLMKEIIDNLAMPGLSCDVFSVEFKHLKKGYIAGHARCFVKIKDDKYGVNQSVFDDPTWDNDESLTHKYAHFAMPNDSHEQNKNGLYEYGIPYKTEYSNKKAMLEILDDNMCRDNFNHSINQIDQLMVEKVYYNMLKKKMKGAREKEVLSILSKMAKDSFDEQTSREFTGNLTSPQLLLFNENISSKDDFDEENEL